MARHIIYNAEIVNENKRFHGYVVIDGAYIESIGEGNPSDELMGGCQRMTDAGKCMLLPGAIDDQVHFRDPGLTHKADISTESAAAVAGGVTSFMDMPNTIPQTTTIEALASKNDIAAEKSIANYSFFIGATNDNIDILKKVDYKHTCGVKLFLGASTGNMLVDNKAALHRIFSEVPSLIAIHSEDEGIIRANREKYISRHADNLPIFFHPLIRSEEACYASTARAIELAEKCNTRLHVLHISTGKELGLFSTAPICDKKITSEVCVHHLWYTDNDYSRLGNRIKWNPAIKTTADRNELRQGVIDGRIDIVATDHAPHLLSEKEGNVLHAASGAPLVQYSLPMMLEMWKNRVFGIEKVVEKMCHAPAELYRIEKRGYLRPGYFADMVIIDSNAQYKVERRDILSKCGWSPMEGETLSCKVIKTFVNGEVVYDNGKINKEYKGAKLSFNR